jgi:hypothetical protein
VTPQWQDARSTHAIIGRSFYEKLVPPQTTDLIFSFTALHWGRQLHPMPTVLTEDECIRIAARHVDEDMASMRLLVRNAVLSMREGAVTVWSFFGLPPFDRELEKSAMAIFTLFADALGRTLGLTGAELGPLVHSYAVLRQMDILQEVLRENDHAIEVIDLKLDVGPAVPIDMSLSVAAKTIAGGILAANLVHYTERAREMHPQQMARFVSDGDFAAVFAKEYEIGLLQYMEQHGLLRRSNLFCMFKIRDGVSSNK